MKPGIFGLPERIAHVLNVLVNNQVRQPITFLVLALIVTVPAAILARQLELRTGFESLLPENKPSVTELTRVAKRTAGVSTLAIVIDGEDKLSLQRLGDALLPHLRALGPNWVGTAENGVHAERDFLQQRQALYLPLEKVRELDETVESRFQQEVFGSIDEDEAPPITRDLIQKEIHKAFPQKSSGPSYLDGYYMNAKGKRLIVLVRASGDLERSFELQHRVRAVIEQVRPQSFHPSIQTGLTGDIVTSAEQYNVVKNDLASVGAAGITMILLIDFLFFLRLRAVFAMATSIAIGVIWTFGITRLTIGHLNTASGFLVSIIFGNGINFGILLRARYGEARRAGLTAAYRDTFRPTLTVAAAAGAGYLSLATTSFRGFRDFGIIGGYGMLLCWAANFLFMPPLLVLFERVSPTWRTRKSTTLWSKFNRLADRGIPFGAPFAWLSAHLSARVIAIAGAIAVLLGTLASVQFVKRDPLNTTWGTWRMTRRQLRALPLDSVLTSRTLLGVRGKTEWR